MAKIGSGFRPDQENASYIGAGVTLRGEVSVPDTLVVDGAVEGRITARALIVGRTGAIRGEVSVTMADVSGYVANDLAVERLLVVRSTGRVEGRVIYGGIELERGAVVTGDLSAADDDRGVSGLQGVEPERAAFPAPRTGVPLSPATLEQKPLTKLRSGPVLRGAGLARSSGAG